MLLSRNSGCKGTKFISNAEMFFYLFFCNRASLACFLCKSCYVFARISFILQEYILVRSKMPPCFYKNAVLFLQEKRIYSPSYKIRLYILSSLLGFYLFLHVDELSLAVVEFVLQESEFL